MESHFVKLEPPYQIIHYGGVVGIQIGTLIVVGKEYPGPDGIDIYTHSHPVVSYVDKRQLLAKLGKDRGNRDITSYYGGGEGNVWSKVEVSDVDIIGLSDPNTGEEPIPFEWSDFVWLASDGVALRNAEKGLWRQNGLFDLENYMRRAGLYLKRPAVADHLELDLSILTEKDTHGFIRKCIVCQEDNPELISFFVPIYNKKDQEIIEIIIQQLWQYLSLMKSLGASVVFRETEIPELGEKKMPKDEADVSCLSRIVKTLNETYEEKYRKIFLLRQKSF